MTLAVFLFDAIFVVSVGFCVFFAIFLSSCVSFHCVCRLTFRFWVWLHLVYFQFFPVSLLFPVFPMFVGVFLFFHVSPAYPAVSPAFPHHFPAMSPAFPPAVPLHFPRFPGFSSLFPGCCQRSPSSLVSLQFPTVSRVWTRSTSSTWRGVLVAVLKAPRAKA